MLRWHHRNFGSAFAAMTLPWFAITVMGDWLGLGDDGWRWAMAVNGLVMGIYGVMYYYLVRDTPSGKRLKKTKISRQLVSDFIDVRWPAHVRR